MLTSVLVPIHRAGWPFIAGGLAFALLLYLFQAPLAWVGLAVALLCSYFFRDPDRVVPLRPGLVVSPADGTVVAVTQAAPPEELGMARVPLDTLRAGSIDESVRIMRDVLGGCGGPTREVVLMNAGAALLAAGKVESMTEGATLAAESIDSRRAGKKLDAFVRLSTSLE